jgi:hypothetical protein
MDGSLPCPAPDCALLTYTSLQKKPLPMQRFLIRGSLSVLADLVANDAAYGRAAHST